MGLLWVRQHRTLKLDGDFGELVDDQGQALEDQEQDLPETGLTSRLADAAGSGLDGCGRARLSLLPFPAVRFGDPVSGGARRIRVASTNPPVGLLRDLDSAE